MEGCGSTRPDFALNETVKKITNLDYFESYNTVASWSTIRLVINISAQCVWTTWQVDLFNAFVQATLKEEFYLKIPAMFSEKNENSEETVVLKLSKSIYIIVQTPRTWYKNIQKGFTVNGNVLQTRDDSHHLSL